jgi:hypothetical protein
MDEDLETAAWRGVPERKRKNSAPRRETLQSNRRVSANAEDAARRTVRGRSSPPVRVGDSIRSAPVLHRQPDTADRHDGSSGETASKTEIRPLRIPLPGGRATQSPTASSALLPGRLRLGPPPRPVALVPARSTHPDPPPLRYHPPRRSAAGWKRNEVDHVLVPSRAGFIFSMPLALLFPVMTNW